MLNDPDVIATLNAETHPVRILFNDGGWPSIGAFDVVRDQENKPWLRSNSATWVLADASGERLLGSNMENAFRYFLDPTFHVFSQDTLVRALERASRLADLDDAEGVTADEERGRLDRELAEIDAHIRRGSAAWRMVLTRAICTLNPMIAWDTYVDRMRPVAEGEFDPVAPGMRNAVIRELANFITTDEPLDPGLTRSIERLTEEWMTKTGRRPVAAPDGNPLPVVLREAAVDSLSLLTGLDWQADDAGRSRLAVATDWWSEHKREPRFDVHYSDDPELRFVVLRENPIEEATHGAD